MGRKTYWPEILRLKYKRRWRQGCPTGLSTRFLCPQNRLNTITLFSSYSFFENALKEEENP
jgi:hypothetical protein